MKIQSKVVEYHTLRTDNRLPLHDLEVSGQTVDSYSVYSIVHVGRVRAVSSAKSIAHVGAVSSIAHVGAVSSAKSIAQASWDGSVLYAIRRTVQILHNDVRTQVRIIVEQSNMIL